jgi:hypothetical protein
MNVNAPAQTGLVGIERGLEDMNANAASIASASQAQGNNPTDLAKPLVVMAMDEAQIGASVKVVKAADETLGSLLDVTA